MGCYRQEWLNAARCLEDGPSEFCQFAGLTPCVLGTCGYRVAICCVSLPKETFNSYKSRYAEYISEHFETCRHPGSLIAHAAWRSEGNHFASQFRRLMILDHVMFSVIHGG